LSKQNVEIVREVYAVLDRMDLAAPSHTDLAELGGLLDREVEWHGTIGGLSEGRIARGPEEVLLFLQEDTEAWDDVLIEPQFLDAGDQVVVLQHERRKGKASGVETEVDTAFVVTVRGGKVVRGVGHMDQAKALEAARLGE
jgi:ketosteroid isomerase-like protein